MIMKQFKKSLSFVVCMMLIAAMAFFTIGCNDNNDDIESPASDTSTSQTEPKVLGEGETMFTFTVTDGEGIVTTFEIHTNKTVVGEALLELGLIAGDEGAFGLYVKTVNEITVDYDTDGKYWSFYENGKYASKGVDTTDITPNATYSFKVEK